MNRFALIIESSDVKGQTDLPGARKDASNWSRFLMSNAGGAWDASEIRILNKPLLELVSYYLEDHRQDYCFVAYSGHGCEIKHHSWDSRGTPTVCLNESEQQVPLASLLPHGKYGTLVSDSCRGHEVLQKTAADFSDRGGSRAMSAEDSAGSFSRILHRNAWNLELQHHCTGLRDILAMYSCASGQSADESPDAGGLYTSLLIRCAEIWYGISKAGMCYTTWDAHVAAEAIMKKVSPQQCPEYDRLPTMFPFAVKA